MSELSFHVVYDGPALDTHEMDVRDLAPALLALGELFEHANRVLNGNRAKVSVRVKASFETGCFGVELAVVQSLVSQTLDFLVSKPVTGAIALAGLIGVVDNARRGLVKVIQWLRGRVPSKVEYLSNGTCRIVVDAETFEVEREVVELLKDYHARKAVEGAIAAPLNKDGIDTVAFKPDGKTTFLVIEKQERVYFVAPPPEDTPLSDIVDTVNLQVLSPAFREGNKWRVTDGTAPFYAEVTDRAFLGRVQRNEEVFAKDDIFTVRLRKKQSLTLEGIKTDAYIEEVIEHRSAAHQVRIQTGLFDEPR